MGVGSRFLALFGQSDGWFHGHHVLGGTPEKWSWLGFGLAKGFLIAFIVTWIVRRVLRGVKRRIPDVVWPEGFESRLTLPLGLIVVAVTFGAWEKGLEFSEGTANLLGKAATIVLIFASTLLLIRLLAMGRDYLRVLLTRGVTDLSKVRSVTTRVNVPVHILQFLITVAGFALVCLQFQAVEQVGVSILASAGLAGVILGLAAQRTVSNLLAGLQLAFAQPLRIGDQVVAEGEFGEVEEIGLTQVVLKLWDLRRLILPVSYFVEKPFLNSTKGTPELLGTVFVYADHSVRVQDVRDELKRIVEASDLWDRKVQRLEVTKLSADSVELRAVISSRDSSDLWSLQCLVRERLFGWLQAQKSGPAGAPPTDPNASRANGQPVGANGR